MPIKRTYASQGDGCAASHAMELLGDRWAYPILRELMLSPKRFSDLEASLIGITSAVLVARLRQLEAAGLVERVRLSEPARVWVYDATDWAKQLRPVFEALGRWAVQSPTRQLDGCGLTPAATVQSMLAMAPEVEIEPPLSVELRLTDTRLGTTAPVYTFHLTWGSSLDIVSGSATNSQATISGDSSMWVAVLYDGLDAGVMEVDGDAGVVQQLIAAYASSRQLAAPIRRRVAEAQRGRVRGPSPRSRLPNASSLSTGRPQSFITAPRG